MFKGRDILATGVAGHSHLTISAARNALHWWRKNLEETAKYKLKAEKHTYKSCKSHRSERALESVDLVSGSLCDYGRIEPLGSNYNNRAH
jgi:hypothetical protein